MADKDQSKRSGKDGKQGKVGSDPEAAKAFGGKHDFGIPANKGHTRDRDYTSQNTKASDPGAAQPHSSEFTGVRTHGAGGMASGEGSSSGGDIDPDIIGVGTHGSGVAANPPGHFNPPGQRPAPDDTDGSTDEMASGPHAAGKEGEEGKEGGDKADSGPSPVYRSMPRANLDVSDQGSDAGTAGANPDAGDDDSFRGEVSASGEGLSIREEQEEQYNEEEGDSEDSVEP